MAFSMTREERRIGGWGKQKMRSGDSGGEGRGWRHSHLYCVI